jgi:hypothetical protein
MAIMKENTAYDCDKIVNTVEEGSDVTDSEHGEI